MTSSKNLIHSNAHIKGYYNVHVGQEFFLTLVRQLRLGTRYCLSLWCITVHRVTDLYFLEKVSCWSSGNDDCWTKISVASMITLVVGYFCLNTLGMWA